MGSAFWQTRAGFQPHCTDGTMCVLEQCLYFSLSSASLSVKWVTGSLMAEDSVSTKLAGACRTVPYWGDADSSSKQHCSLGDESLRSLPLGYSQDVNRAPAQALGGPHVFLPLPGSSCHPPALAHSLSGIFKVCPSNLCFCHCHPALSSHRDCSCLPLTRTLSLLPAWISVVY